MKLTKIKEKIEILEKDLNKKKKFKKELIDLIANLLVLAESKGLNSEEVRHKAKVLLEEWWEKKEKSKKIEVKVKTAYRKWASFYEKMFNPLVLTEDKYMKKLLINVKGKKILDLGCGTGRHAIFLAKKGAVVIGIDFSSEMLREAKKNAKRSRVKINFKKRDITKKLPFKNNSFDIVLCSLVFNHIKNLAPIFKEVSRILKPSGVFIFSDLHPGLISKKRYPLFIRNKVNVYTEWYWHNFSEYINLSKKTNLIIEKVFELKLPREFKTLAKEKDFRVFDKPLCLIMKFRKK